MGLLFWRRKRADPNGVIPANVAAVAVSEDDALPVRPLLEDDDPPVRVREQGIVSAVSLAKRVESSFTRPADTTQYASGEHISTSTTVGACRANLLPGVAREGGGSAIVYDALLLDGANQTTLGYFEAWLFSKPFTIPAADNAAVALTAISQEAGLVGILSFDTTYIGNAGSGAAGNVVFQTTGINKWVVCEDGNLYWVLVARSAYTPVSGEKFTLVLFIGQN